MSLKDNVISIASYFALIGLIVFALGGFSNRKENVNQAKPIKTSVIFKQCMRIYKESGLNGLIKLSKKYYEEFDDEPTIENLRHATMIDIFSIKIDTSITDTAGFPKHPYFEYKSFIARVLPRLSKAGKRTATFLNGWIHEANNEIDRMVNEESAVL